MDNIKVFEQKQRTETAPVYWIKDADGNEWTVIRNSKIGGCPREIWAHWKGMEPSRTREVIERELGEFDSDPMEEGHLHEAHIQRLMVGAGWILDGFEQEFSACVGRRVMVVGHADMGRAIDPRTGVDYCGEIKTMGREAFGNFLDKGLEAYPNYAIQFSMMMYALGKPGMLIVKNRDNGKILSPMFYHEPPVPISDIIKRVALIMKCVESDQMPPCSSFRNVLGNWCNFQQLHEDDPPEERVVVERPDLCSILEEYQALGSTKKEVEIGGEIVSGKDRRSELLEIIKAAMSESGAKVLVAGGLKITEGEPKKVFDEDAFKMAHPELWKKFRTKDQRGAFRVSKSKRGV